MTAPPIWVTRTARRVDLDGFVSHFGEFRAGSFEVFFKIETWQTYQEPETRSLLAFLDGDVAAAERLIRAEADDEYDGYQLFQKKRVPFTRIRLVERPLTPYMRWELLNYAVRIEPRYGEDVRIVDVTGKHTQLPDESSFDFVVFGPGNALVHDYGEDGLQIGGWVVSSPGVVADLIAMAEARLAEAVPLDEFDADRAG